MIDGADREVMTVGLPDNGADRVYVLWRIDGAVPRAVGTFDVAADRTGPQTVGAVPDGTFAQYAISLERGRAAPAAPSAVVAVGTVEA
jgi:hypothetical protein